MNVVLGHVHAPHALAARIACLRLRRLPQRRRDGRVHRRGARARAARRPDDGARRARPLDSRRPHGARGDGARRPAGCSAERSASGRSSTRSRSARSRTCSSRSSRMAGRRPRARWRPYSRRRAGARVGVPLRRDERGAADGARSATPTSRWRRSRPSAPRSSSRSSPRRPRRRRAACTSRPRGRSCSRGCSRRAPRRSSSRSRSATSGSSRVSMIFGTAPLVVGDDRARLPRRAGQRAAHRGRGAHRRGRRAARPRARAPAHLSRIGLVFAFAGATLFAIRDNLVRHLAVGSTAVPPAVAAAAALLGGLVLVAVWARRGISRRWLPFLPAGVLFGASYVSLFEAYYRGRVTVVAPLVAIESLVGVGAVGAPPPRLGAGGEEARLRRAPDRRRRRPDRRLPLRHDISAINRLRFSHQRRQNTTWRRPSASTWARRTRAWPCSRAASRPSSRTPRAGARRRPSSRSRRTASGSSALPRGGSRSRTRPTRSSRSSASWGASSTRSRRR